jgi:hypothetical protein
MTPAEEHLLRAQLAYVRAVQVLHAAGSLELAAHRGWTDALYRYGSAAGKTLDARDEWRAVVGERERAADELARATEAFGSAMGTVEREGREQG